MDVIVTGSHAVNSFRAATSTADGWCLHTRYLEWAHELSVQICSLFTWQAILRSDRKVLQDRKSLHLAFRVVLLASSRIEEPIYVLKWGYATLPKQTRKTVELRTEPKIFESPNLQ